jgi:hypothetical protein
VRPSSFVLLAAYIGKTRLIDNLLVETSREDSEELTFQL